MGIQDELRCNVKTAQSERRVAEEAEKRSQINDDARESLHDIIQRCLNASMEEKTSLKVYKVPIEDFDVCTTLVGCRVEDRAKNPFYIKNASLLIWLALEGFDLNPTITVETVMNVVGRGTTVYLTTHWIEATWD